MIQEPQTTETKSPPAFKLNDNEKKVLAFLVAVCNEGNATPFSPIMECWKLSRPDVRRACRSLRRKRLAEYWRGLWTEHGDPAGAGYGATVKGREDAYDQCAAEIEKCRDWGWE